MSAAIIIFIAFAALVAVAILRRVFLMWQLASRGSHLGNTVAKISNTIETFRKNVPEQRLTKSANKYDLYYYIGYITAMAKTTAIFDGVSPDGVILAPIQMEASRLFGQKENGSDLEEGAALLREILKNRSAEIGHHEGDIDGQYAANPSNPGPYFGRLRTYFEIVI